MTLAEAHIWIAVFTREVAVTGIYPEAVKSADAVVRSTRERSPERLKELDEALRQGSDIP